MSALHSNSAYIQWTQGHGTKLFQGQEKTIEGLHVSVIKWKLMMMVNEGITERGRGARTARKPGHSRRREPSLKAELAALRQDTSRLSSFLVLSSLELSDTQSL